MDVWCGTGLFILKKLHKTWILEKSMDSRLHPCPNHLPLEFDYKRQKYIL